MSVHINIVDRNALKFNQVSIVLLSVIGFVLDNRWFPALTGAALLLGSIVPAASLFKVVYRYVVIPLKILKPDISEESPAPHRFAQLVGGTFLTAGSLLLFNGLSAAGWILTWIVILLAGINVVFGFCAGCFVHFQLARLGVPGFRTVTPEGKNV
jgi:hypothetical protein